ncbi:hypothetical protein IFM89_002413 [Coptis chinensis]|uniref:DUF4283 domain-containing protein n=1 Tax=Coptis chinensis TaxID=261450 RepID=A0A835INA8_9MAGN|nr:hypothetical protein IFM89_002413 [Coptis chinensis]
MKLLLKMGMRSRMRMNRSILVKPVWKRLSYPFVKESLNKHCKVKGNYEMIADRDLLYFKFVNEEDRKMVIEHGPLFIAGRIFVVRPWSESIEQHRNKMKSLPIWVKLDLPKQLWTSNGIDFVSSIIGEPICMDNATANRTRLSYARICAFVNTDFKFPSSIRVNLGDGKEVDISLEYDWIPSLCKICNIFGHADAKCHKNKKAQATQNPKHVRAKPTKKQPQRWTPKKNTQGGQTSSLRDDGGAPILGDCEVTSIVVVESQQSTDVQIEQHENEQMRIENPLEQELYGQIVQMKSLMWFLLLLKFRATKVVLGTHRDVAPAKDTYQDVAFAHMNAEISNVDLNVGVQVDTVPVLVDVAIVANASQNIMIVTVPSEMITNATVRTTRVTVP